MYFHDPSKRKAIQIVPGFQGRTFWGENLMLVVVTIDAMASLPEHSHPHEQAGLVVKGELELTIGGESKLLAPGDVYMIPSGVRHSAVAGSEPVQVLDIFTPTRDDLKY